MSHVSEPSRAMAGGRPLRGHSPLTVNLCGLIVSPSRLPAIVMMTTPLIESGNFRCPAIERLRRRPYSVLSASSGLSRAARRAGSQHAIRATPSRTSVVAAKTPGSRGLIP
jgi:hypothetical protein